MKTSPQLILINSNDFLEVHMIKWLSHAYGITLSLMGFKGEGILESCLID